jgi:hypothetical protein
MGIPNIEEHLSKLEQPAEMPATQQMPPGAMAQPHIGQEIPPITPQLPVAQSNAAGPAPSLPVGAPPNETRRPPSYPAASSGPAVDAVKPQSPLPPPVENSLDASAERMTDGRLKVQAIVWSPTPEDRMAVINSAVVREGGTLEGFTIVGIGENAVYVREDGGGLLKVPFGKP